MFYVVGISIDIVKSGIDSSSIQELLRQAGFHLAWDSPLSVQLHVIMDPTVFLGNIYLYSALWLAYLDILLMPKPNEPKQWRQQVLISQSEAEQGQEIERSIIT